MGVNTGVLDCPIEQGPLTQTQCKLDCFRHRETYRHTLRPLITAEKHCKKEPTCKETLASMKSAYHALITGTQTKSIDVNGKSYTNHQGSIECLKEEIYALECKCGKYAAKVQKSRCGCGGSGQCIPDVCCGCSCGGCGCGGGYAGSFNLNI